MPTLGLAMIVRNEQKNLPVCLSSIKGLCDEIVIVDTGSTDGTKEIAKAFGAKIFDFAWIDDFAAARNFSFSNVRSDYIFWLDADDEILPKDLEKLRQVKSRLGSANAYLMVYDYAQDEYGRSIMEFLRHRIVKNGVGIHWKYPIHECLQFPPNTSMETTDVVITHRRKGSGHSDRNLNLLRKAVKDMPDDQRMRFYLAKECYSANLFEEAAKNFEEHIAKWDFHDSMVHSHVMLGRIYSHLKKEKEAIDISAKGIAIDPRWAEFYVTPGQIYYQRASEAQAKGNWGEAGEHWRRVAWWFERAKKCEQPDSWGFVDVEHYTYLPADRLCKAYSEMGRLLDANRENEIAIKYRPGDPRIQGNRAYLWDILYDRLNERPYRLNLGGGQKPVPSYRNCDLYPGGRVEFVLDQGKLPYPDGTVHAIYSEHALEHSASHESAKETIQEWARALRHGGHLTLKVPDLDQCCKSFAASEDRPRKPEERWTEKEWYKYTIYGIQKGQGTEPAEGQYHRTGFTQAELRRLLEANGFVIDYIGTYDGWGTPSIEVRAIQRRQSAKVRWLIRGKSEDEPSTRIRRLNVSKWLNSRGIDSKVSEAYAQGSVDVGALLAELRIADVVVFTQFSAVDRELMERLNRAGVATVYDMNEDLEDYEGLEELLDTAKVNIFCSTALKEKYGENRTGFAIFDAFETPEKPLDHSYAPHGKDGKVRVLWSGMGGNAQNAEFLRPICQELGMEFLVMSEWQTADISWKKETWLEHLNGADIVVSPQRMQVQNCKSNTKATQPMSLGIPIVVSPLQAYKECVKDRENGFICSTPEEWKAVLTALRDSQELRERIGKNAKAAVTGYSIDMVGLRWFVTLSMLCHENCNPPKVDIIIPTFNNLEYLKVCIESIRKNTDWPHNIIVVNSGTDGTAEWLTQQPDVIAVNSKTRFHFSTANNAGLAVAKEKYVCLLNDDTIVSEGWLGAMMHEAMKPGIGAVGPFSNCDKTWLHQEAIMVEGRDLYPGMDMSGVQGIIPKIYKWKHRKEVHPRGWLAFYCTLMPRVAVDKVGLLDDSFKSGDEDLDYCRRLSNAGYVCRQTYDSWVFHFGGRTRKFAEGLDKALHQAEDRANHDRYRAKWGDFDAPKAPVRKKKASTPAEPQELALDAGGDRKLFVLYTGPAWERWSPLSVDEGGIGGSETCAVYVAREFAKKGWKSIVFGDCAGMERDYDGVTYVDHSKFASFAAKNKIDFFVSSRRADVFALPIQATRKAVWVHDIWLDANGSANLNIERIDKVFCLSPWHKKFFLNHHKGVPAEKVHVTRDGVDLARFEGKVRKIPGRMVYSSSPDRGLELLLDLLPQIQKEVPEAEVHIFYGFENWEKSARARGDQGQLTLIEKLKKKFNDPGVVYRGRVGQKTLAREFMKAQLWAYPTWFTETFCITACEAMASGTPVVTTDVAALATTVGEAGVVLPVPKNQWDCGMTQDAAFQKKFVEECISLLTDEARWKKYSTDGLEKAGRFGWNGIVEDWLSAVGFPIEQAAFS